MSGPACIDQEIWQGDDTPPLVWGFGAVGASEIPTGARFRLEVGWLGRDAGGFTVLSPDGGLVVAQAEGTVTWTYSVAQSAGIPRGGLARYQLRCLYDGATQTWAFGQLIARGAVPLVGA